MTHVRGEEALPFTVSQVQYVWRRAFKNHVENIVLLTPTVKKAILERQALPGYGRGRVKPGGPADVNSRAFSACALLSCGKRLHSRDGKWFVGTQWHVGQVRYCSAKCRGIGIKSKEPGVHRKASRMVVSARRRKDLGVITEDNVGRFVQDWDAFGAPSLIVSRRRTEGEESNAPGGAFMWITVAKERASNKRYARAKVQVDVEHVRQELGLRKGDSGARVVHALRRAHLAAQAPVAGQKKSRRSSKPVAVQKTKKKKKTKKTKKKKKKNVEMRTSLLRMAGCAGPACRRRTPTSHTLARTMP